MKFMVTWKVPVENFKKAMSRLKVLAQEKAPAGVKFLGRWHETGTGKGFALLEVEDMTAFTGLLMSWEDLSNQTVVPVVEDDAILKNL
jgi:hypothetical protein